MALVSQGGQSRMRVKGFSLIETAMVLLIIGVMAATVIKGQDLLETARMRACFQQMQQYVLLISQYRQLYGYYPGDDPRASLRNPKTPDGAGKGFLRTDSQEQQLVWRHLYDAGLIDSPQPPQSRLTGNLYLAVSDDAQALPHLLLAGNRGQGVLTAKQALKMKTLTESHTDPQEGRLRFKSLSAGADSQGGCIVNGRFNLNTTAPMCVAWMPVE